jgi:hypothetical protein
LHQLGLAALREKEVKQTVAAEIAAIGQSRGASA